MVHEIMTLWIAWESGKKTVTGIALSSADAKERHSKIKKDTWGKT